MAYRRTPLYNFIDLAAGLCNTVCLRLNVYAEYSWFVVELKTALLLVGKLIEGVLGSHDASAFEMLDSSRC